MQTSIRPTARIWALVREERSDIIAIYFFAVLSGLIQLSLPLGIQSIIGYVLGGTLSASLVVLISFLVAAVLFSGIMQVNQMKIIERIQQKIFVRYSYIFADRIPKLDLKQVDGFYLPELVNRFFDTVSLQKSLSKLLLDLPLAMIQILFGLVLLSFYHPFFILFGVLLLSLLWLILYATGSQGLQSSLTESTYKYQVAGWLEEMARLVNTFKFSRNSGLHLQKADNKTINYIRARTTHFKVLLLQYKSLIAFKVVITAAMLIVGVVLLLNEQINIGQFVAAEIIILMVMSAVEKIIINLDSVYDALTAVEKIGKLTEKPVEGSGTYKALPQAYSVEAKALSFSYGSGRKVLENLSFSIGSAQKVCIMGSEGSGKSTLLKLLTGIYQDFDGSLLINGIPVNNYELSSLRTHMGIVFPQENIFNGSLWENLTMGKDDTDPDHIRFLTNQTGLSKFLEQLPDGYDTELDPTGKRLPRNVIQKILLVRALACRPSLLIMEEPWQGIEAPYQENIRRILLGLAQTTVIVSTSDQAFASQCDQILRLDLIENH